jgi:hypothetical protein
VCDVVDIGVMLLGRLTLTRELQAALLLAFVACLVPGAKVFTRLTQSLAWFCGSSYKCVGDVSCTAGSFIVELLRQWLVL